MKYEKTIALLEARIKTCYDNLGIDTEFLRRAELEYRESIIKVDSIKNEIKQLESELNQLRYPNGMPDCNVSPRQM